MPNYIEPADLARLIRPCPGRAARTLTNDLAALLMQIAAGVHRRFRYIRDKDEFLSAAMLFIVETEVVSNADPSKNLFNYFTTVFRHFGEALRDENIKRLADDANYRELIGRIADRLDRRRESIHSTPGDDHGETLSESTLERDLLLAIPLVDRDLGDRDDRQPPRDPDNLTRAVTLGTGRTVLRLDAREGDRRHRRDRGRRRVAHRARSIRSSGPRMAQAIA